METKSTQKGGTLCIPAAAVLDASREAAGKAHVLSRNSLHFCCHRRRNTRLDGPYTWPRRAFLLLLPQEGMVQVVLTCSVRINYLRLRSAKPVQKKQKVFWTASLPGVPLNGGWELGHTECGKKKTLNRIQRLFCLHHPSCQKMLRSLPQRTVSACSGGHKRFKVQLHEKVLSLELCLLFVCFLVRGGVFCFNLAVSSMLFWLLVCLTICERRRPASTLILRLPHERRAHLLSMNKRNCCCWQSCFALRRVKMGKKRNVCF